ncbi:hypothetical protein HanXRQr2_Chr13g0610761 [Helianthus annuus]|uniref:Uncharacterized protein n=1 Tax=Helianthus annuus TaxID=4232 RepID=A0A9K3EKB2_HELAN|nr:hypothetical protein HanXRQr2_Chr13g0610761 [Helianthus annuus]
MKEEDEKIHYNYSLHHHHITSIQQARLENSVGPTLRWVSSTSLILKNANWEAKPNQEKGHPIWDNLLFLDSPVMSNCLEMSQDFHNLLYSI